MERNVRLWTLNEKQYPGIEPFFGLAQSTSQQLNELVHTKGKPITKEQICEAVAGWNAYTASNPIEIETWITTTNGSLPFLKKAFETHLTYFPSSQNGLNEVENLIFNFINIRTCSFTEIFQLENLLLPILLDAFSPPPPTNLSFRKIQEPRIIKIII